MKVLLLIDLQTGFDASYDKKLLKTVSNQIKKARSENIPIISLEYINDGDLQPILQNELEGYNKKYTVEKRVNNGGPEVVQVLEKLSILEADLYVCGVNTSACVISTIRWIQTESKHNINVIENGCNDQDRDWHKTYIERMINEHKIKLIRSKRSKPYNYTQYTHHIPIIRRSPRLSK